MLEWPLLSLQSENREGKIVRRKKKGEKICRTKTFHTAASPSPLPTADGRQGRSDVEMADGCKHDNTIAFTRDAAEAFNLSVTTALCP